MLERRYLVLEDGTFYEGYKLSSDELSIGEIVFNTAMTGYQETISDPSYTGQIITFTYPLIGNYGINRDDFEALTPTLNGVVVKASTHQVTLDSKNIARSTCSIQDTWNFWRRYT